MSMMPNIEMPPFPMEQDGGNHSLNATHMFYPIKSENNQDINTGTATIHSSHAELSSMQYQTLKQHSTLTPKIELEPPLPFQPQPFLSPIETLPPQQVQPPSIQSVFIIDSKGSEQQEIEVINPNNPSPTMCPLPIIPEDEQDILKDIEMDSMLYGNANEPAPMNVDEDPEMDLTIKIKQQTNLFDPDIVHTEIVHPKRDSAEERASVLLSRAFAPTSPELTRMSIDFANRLSMNQQGFGDSFARSSQNLFAPISDEFRISENFRMSENHNYSITEEQYPSINMNENYSSNPLYLQQLQQYEQLQQLQPIQPINSDNMDIFPNINDGDNSRLSISSGSSSGTIRDKHRACVRCHKAKKKCVRPDPGGRCLGCRKKNIPCVARTDGRTNNRVRRRQRKQN